jgi:hypothetical protein
MSPRIPSTGARPLPILTRIGLVVVGFGLLNDLAEHGFGSTASDVAVTGFSIAQHAAHLVVLVGMVAVLAGIVVDGIRISRSRPTRPGRSHSHAVR